MTRDDWGGATRKFGYYEGDDEPETVERVVRAGGRTLSGEDAAVELERERVE